MSLEEKLEISLDALPVLRGQLCNALRRANIKTLRDLVLTTRRGHLEQELLKIRYVNRKSLEEIRFMLDSIGITHKP